MKGVAFFVPTIDECTQIFPSIKLSEWKHEIQYGKYDDYDVFVSGISKTNTAFSTSLIFQTIKIESAYLIGIAGAYKRSGLSIGDLVCVNNDYFVDEGMSLNGKISLTSEMGFPVCDNNKVQYKHLPNVRNVDANTVSWLSSEDGLAEQYHIKTKASIETMEGASFGLVAGKMGVSAYQIRAISNYCGNRNSQEWNVKSAFKSLRKAVLTCNFDGI